MMSPIFWELARPGTWKEAPGREGGPAHQEGLQQGHTAGGHIHSPTQPGRAASNQEAVCEGGSQHRQGPPRQVAHWVDAAVPPQLGHLQTQVQCSVSSQQ